MAWNAKKISVVAGALALLTEAGLNNGLILGIFYAAASGVAAPVIVRGVVVAHDAAEAHLAEDRRRYAESGSGNLKAGAAPDAEAGDADQPALQTDGDAADSPDMPRRLGPMLIQRRAFLAAYEGDPARARPILPAVDRMLTDDRRAFASFARRAARDPVWASAQRGDLAELHAIDARLDKLRASAAGE